MSQFPDTHPFLGTITRPTLIVDTPKAQANINRMATKARTADLHFRPHFKTIQSAKAAEWFRAEGVTKITVSSVKMAQYFAAHHWQDILIAFPANPREAQVLNALAQNIHLGLIADHPQTIQALAQVLHHPVDLWIEVDCGHRRTGIPTHYPEEIIALAHQLRHAGELLRQRAQDFRRVRIAELDVFVDSRIERQDARQHRGIEFERCGAERQQRGQIADLPGLPT